MFVTKYKTCGKFAVTCKFVKKFLLDMLAIHKRRHGASCDKVLNEAGGQANYELHCEEIAENEANEALVTSLSHSENGYSYSLQYMNTVNGSFYWDDNMQQLPVDGDFIEVHGSSFRKLLATEQWR